MAARHDMTKRYGRQVLGEVGQSPTPAYSTADYSVWALRKFLETQTQGIYSIPSKRKESEMPYNSNTSGHMFDVLDADDVFDDIESGEEVAASAGLDDSGDWDTALSHNSVERWLFPRFAGADKIGRCSATGAPHKGDHAEKKACKDWQVDSGNMYISRSGVGSYDTDVETVEAWLEAPRTVVVAVLLLGEPGTGKTALIEAAVTRLGRDLTTVLCTPDHTQDSLFMRFVGEGKGDGGSPFTLGPVARAARDGHVLYLDETMMLNDGVKVSIYALADGRRFMPEGNVDGSPLEIHPDFRLILSSNPLVRGASLPEPLASRTAGTTLTVATEPGLLAAMGVDEAIIAAWVALGSSNLWRPQIRELRVADYWAQRGQTSQAASALVPEHCPESQRDEVRRVVASFLGGALRDDGRLVVS